ncbi:hypothetical protein DER45DRAFT_611274 [Fusarium avenaceum]|nr:hypothetical protein DER45DRAFT_611274 [Fusarium avenaceum]
MAGVPSGRGCDSCRKQKKKCDQAKPACARCARLKIPCTGSGVKRFVFKSENSQASGKRSRALVATITNPQPSAGPRNDKTLIASNLVHIIELSNPAYDISTYGWFVKDLPRHIGSSKSLDAAIGAFVAGFSTLQNNTTSKVHAFHRYGNAVTALRESIRSSAGMNLADRMCSIYLIAICQEWLGNTGIDQSKHYEMLGHLLQNAVQNGNLDPSDRGLMQTMLGVVVLESFTNRNVNLGPWLWKAVSILGESVRPLKSGDGMSFALLDLGTMGEVSCYIRDPDRYLYQIRCTYSLMQLEHPRLIQAMEEAVAKGKQSGSTSLQRRLAIRFHTANAVMLTMACILNRILRSFDNDPALLREAEGFVDQIIVLAEEASFNRPIAASAVSSPLVVALASVEHYRYVEVETLLLEYESDFLGLQYFDSIEMIKKGFEHIDRNHRRDGQLLLQGATGLEVDFRSIDLTNVSDIPDTADSNSTNTPLDSEPGCIIL